MHSETTAETLGRHAERLQAVEKRVDGISTRLDWLLGLIITTLVGVIVGLVKHL